MESPWLGYVGDSTTYSYEFGGSNGLDLLPGTVERLQGEQSHIG